MTSKQALDFIKHVEKQEELLEMSKYEGATLLDKMKELHKKHSVRLDNMREWYDMQTMESRVLSDLEELLIEYEIENQQRVQEEDYNATVDIYRELEVGIKLKKQEHLLELYRARIELQELYHVADSLIERQQALDGIHGVDEQINKLEGGYEQWKR